MILINISKETQTNLYTRMGGVFYFIIIVVGMFNELYVKGKIFVSGDPKATAENLIASEQLLRLAFSGSMIMLLCAIPLVLIMYVLLKPVNGNLALLAVFFNLVSISIEGLNNLNILTALFPLGKADYWGAFQPEQLHILAYHSLRVHSSGYNLSLIFFGMTCFFWGVLIYKSEYFPKWLGILLIICCFCYLTNSFGWFIDPAFAANLVPIILLPSFIAEFSLCIWLLVKGVNDKNWSKQVTNGEASGIPGNSID